MAPTSRKRCYIKISASVTTADTEPVHPIFETTTFLLSFPFCKRIAALQCSLCTELFFLCGVSCRMGWAQQGLLSSEQRWNVTHLGYSWSAPAFSSTAAGPNQDHCHSQQCSGLHLPWGSRRTWGHVLLWGTRCLIQPKPHELPLCWWLPSPRKERCQLSSCREALKRGTEHVVLNMFCFTLGLQF